MEQVSPHRETCNQITPHKIDRGRVWSQHWSQHGAQINATTNQNSIQQRVSKKGFLEKVFPEVAKP